MTDELIIERLRTFDADSTKRYFYGYCRKAYNIFDHRYQLSQKTGMDFYSLAHEYYIHLLLHEFKPLLDKPAEQKLSSWMIQGFHFVVLDALKAYNKEFEHQAVEVSDAVLDYLRSTDREEDMMLQITDAVAYYYKNSTMEAIARNIFYLGFKQKDVAEQLGLTPAAVNQRYKKMMDEVVVPFVIENYGSGLYYGRSSYRMPGDICESKLAINNYAFDEDACREASSVELSAHHLSIVPSHNRESGFEDFIWNSTDAPIANTFDLPTSDLEGATQAPATEPEANESAPSRPSYYVDRKRITPRLVRSLRANEIFVFGTNLAGVHAGDTASRALQMFGAESGKGVGPQGQSYAIPTMQGGVDTIRPYVNDFIEYATQHPKTRFLVAPIGCDIAGFEPQDIAPLFEAAREVSNITLPIKFWRAM